MQSHLSECKTDNVTNNSNNTEKRKFDETSDQSESNAKRTKMEDSSEQTTNQKEEHDKPETWWKSPQKSEPMNHNNNSKEQESIEQIDISTIDRPGILQYLEDPSWLSVLAPEFIRPYFKVKKNFAFFDIIIEYPIIFGKGKSCW